MSGKKKGLSVEEKRKRLLQMFYEKQDFFNLKEVEKYGSKEKGITAMTVKDILQSLVDDSMVDTERIGTSNYYWAFPSKGLQIRKRKIGEMSEELARTKARREELTAAAADAGTGREETEERATAIAEMEEQESILAKVEAELAQYRASDPEVIAARIQETQVCLDAANRWTDNMFSMKSVFRNNFNLEEADFNKAFGVPAELDYVELK
ncbi:hypothetical protein CAOG_07199 [Capsaspora owczarzaki ATCC 30864]|uniref:Meiotic nuclear division protein 1 homolog n=1 Tax=Capsaspora owczarzaki (strain ATCC 30864) TaxID=595528 RepID=A0A0D2X503_CAPO3|nr:hypothetical protein CAOG_07199 [Capsaspora owczarzaki ATCC 30864]KJE96959.1 hypothetical protein CAOG_007199 [Capsaspora owczarzaki ATCC 30864]|eukprot:XP_004343923.2 hypothetical protein CAOG_07199 [Capsaspora owczarzaki ATCC 30864]